MLNIESWKTQLRRTENELFLLICTAVQCRRERGEGAEDVCWSKSQKKAAKAELDLMVFLIAWRQSLFSPPRGIPIRALFLYFGPSHSKVPVLACPRAISPGRTWGKCFEGRIRQWVLLQFRPFAGSVTAAASYQKSIELGLKGRIGKKISILPFAIRKSSICPRGLLGRFDGRIG